MADIDNVEIEPLSEDELENVAGGLVSDPVADSSSGQSCCSCSCCSPNNCG